MPAVRPVTHVRMVHLMRASSPTRIRSELPAVMREGLVRLGHLVRVFATLHSGTKAVARVKDLVHQALGHGLLATLTGVTHHPAQSQGGRATTLDLDRNLVGRATNTSGLDLKSRLDVVERALERDDRIGACLGPSTLERAVHDGLGDGLLAVHEDLVDQLGDQRRTVDRVDDKWPLRGGALTWHYFFSIFAPYLLRACLRFLTPWVSSEPRTILYRTPGRSFTRPPRTSTIECSCRLCPSSGIYAITSMPFVSRTLATLRSAEFGFFGVLVITCRQTPRRCGHLSSAGALDFA